MRKLRITILVFGDIAAAYIALFSALYIKYGAVFSGEYFYAHLWHFTIIYIFWFLIFFVCDLFGVGRTVKLVEFLRNYIIASAIAVGTAIIYFYAQTPLNIITPGTFLLLNAGIFFVLSFLWHRFFFLKITKSGLKKKVVVIGVNETGKIIFREIKNNPGLGYEVLFFVDTGENGASEKKVFSDIDTVPLKYFRELFAKGLCVDLVVVAVNLEEDKDALDELFSALSFSKIEFVNAMTFYEKLTGKVLLKPISKIWFLENIHYSKSYGLSKKILDLIFGFLVGCLFVLILPFVAIMIKLVNSGSVFYKQDRVGIRGRVFTLYKFRTMVNNAELNGPMFAQCDDARVTKVGRFLRKLRLDELPQVINILRGDMSLVGPRPERLTWIEKFEREIPFHKERSLVKPGLTGWAQVNWQYASNVETMKTRLQYDLFYIKNGSFFLDLEIILKTVKIILTGRGR